MISNDFNALKNIFIERYKEIAPFGGTGENFPIKKHEISPREYLQFAELIIEKADIDKIDLKDKISIVSNLKRACDCQIDIFLCFININNIIKNNNLRFNKKMDFLYEIGLFPKRAILNIVNIRNKIEHEFIKPNIDDVVVYYDLVYALIIVIEKQIAILSKQNLLEETFGEYVEGGDNYTIEYDFGNAAIIAKIKQDGKTVEFKFLAQEDYELYMKSLHLFFILVQNESKMNDEYTIGELKKL